MMQNCFSEDSSQVIAVEVVLTDEFDTWLEKQSDVVKRWVETTKFSGKSAQVCLLPDADQGLSKVLCGVKQLDEPWCLAHLPNVLPEGAYSITLDEPALQERVTIEWGLACYRFQRYKKCEKVFPKLALDTRINAERVDALVSSSYFTRDLINIPAEEMGPTELGKEAQQLAYEYGAKFKQIVGKDLLKQNFPLIHAVGRASPNEPRLLEIIWGDKKHKKLTLVGKGVCFDTGGLDIKPSGAMLLMRKDMGGSAHVLGLAKAIMQLQLPVYLHVLVPAVENSVGGNSFRPGDIFKSRAGKTVEIGNTDAEGRLVLADAITYAMEKEPDTIIDFATLTGAARVALGPDVPALFTDCDDIANGITEQAKQCGEYLWRMPLHKPYKKTLESAFADTNNVGAMPLGGAITAALFLQGFAGEQTHWAHIDLMAWNSRSRPGRPEGGEAMGLRSVFAYITSALE